MQLYTKIHLRVRLGFPVSSRVPYAEIISRKSLIIFRVKFGHSAFASFIHKTSQIIGNFMISHGQLISLPPCVMPKLERSIGDRKSVAILQPTYLWICPNRQPKCFTLFSLQSYLMLSLSFPTLSFHLYFALS